MRHELKIMLSHIALAVPLFSGGASIANAQESIDGFCAVEFVVGGSKEAVEKFFVVFRGQPAFSYSDCHLRDLKPDADVKARASEKSRFLLKGFDKGTEALAVRCNRPTDAVVHAATDSFLIANDKPEVLATQLLACPTNCQSRYCQDGSMRCIKKGTPPLICPASSWCQ